MAVLLTEQQGACMSPRSELISWNQVTFPYDSSIIDVKVPRKMFSTEPKSTGPATKMKNFQKKIKKIVKIEKF